tara:strand:- start:480 stop:1277 length:798 start_codon:yes stop_codon:yes gene_type:complete
MELTENQLQKFEEEGYIFLPSCFSSNEVKILNDAAEEIYKTDREEVWKESSGVPRTAFAAHTYNAAHNRLAAHPRLIHPIQQILGGDVYMHQYKINAKVAFDGDVWQWHQDFGVWHRDDGMPEPRAMNIAVFLDDVTAANGPLIFLPKSHKLGVIDAGHDIQTTSYPLWTLDRKTVTKLSDEGGCVAPTGPAGSVIMFSSLLVHASPPNISPLPRTIVYLSLCRTDNHITQYKRAEWIAHRDFSPIQALEDDCLEALPDKPAAAE